MARVDDYDTSSNLRLRECHSGTLFKDKIEVGGIMISNKGFIKLLVQPGEQAGTFMDPSGST